MKVTLQWVTKIWFYDFVDLVWVAVSVVSWGAAFKKPTQGTRTVFLPPSCSCSWGEVIARRQRWKQANEEYVWREQGEVRDLVISGSFGRKVLKYHSFPKAFLATEIIYSQTVKLPLQPWKFLPVLVKTSDTRKRKCAHCEAGEADVPCHGGKTALLGGSGNLSPSMP